ncbi:MAG: hypothetical protein ACRCZY_03640 [Phocaeicola sp.]
MALVSQREKESYQKETKQILKEELITRTSWIKISINNIHLFKKYEKKITGPYSCSTIG